METQQPLFSRIVTGHDDAGNAVITSNAPPTRQHLVGGPGGPTFIEVWHTSESPALIFDQPLDDNESVLVLAPPQNGTRIRIIDFPPESEEIRRLTSAGAAEKFKAMGGEHASTSKAGAPHPLMHKTKTIDYGIVLEGEITLVLDKSETTIKSGDIVIQNGTNHAWSNRSGKLCRMAFVLIDGQFAKRVS